MVFVWGGCVWIGNIVGEDVCVFCVEIDGVGCEGFGEYEGECGVVEEEFGDNLFNDVGVNIELVIQVDGVLVEDEGVIEWVVEDYCDLVVI